MPVPPSGKVTGSATHVPPAHSVDEPHGWQCGKALLADSHRLATPSHASQVRQALVPWQVRLPLESTGPSHTRVVVLQR